MNLYSIEILMVLYGASFVCGLLVICAKLKVNYSRKILSIGLFFLFSFLLVERDVSSHWMDFIEVMLIFIIWILSFLQPIRHQSRFLTICFTAFDRPEDRPYTIIWLSTSMVAGYVVLACMVEWLSMYNAQHLIFVTVFVSTFGDGLAEPIGIKFGKYFYETRAVFTNRKYTRTWEGSTCVAISAIVAVIAMMDYMTMAQFIAMLILMPIAMAVTEAKSPHTWDNPFMCLVGGLITVMCLQF